jgi:hypothetical protein
MSTATTVTDAESQSALVAAFRTALGALVSGDEQPRGGEPSVLAELLARRDRPVRVDSAAAGLAAWLVEFAGDDRQRRADVADAAALAARQLAPAGDPPATGAAGQAWHALLITIEHLGGGAGTYPLGRLPFLTPALLAALRAEATAALAGRGPGFGQVGAPAGPVLAQLAVSRQLRAAVSAALGTAVAPTYQAAYLADPPGCLVRPHIDKRGYHLTVHLVLGHDLPSGGGGSPLVVHRAGVAEPQRLRFGPGEGIVLRARGTLHGWARLDSHERRTMLAIGFAPVELHAMPPQENQLE